MNPLIKALSRFEDLPKELEKELIMSFSKTIKLKRRDFFVEEGRICNEVGFVRKGMIRHFYNTNDGEITRWVSTENTFCSSLASFIKEIPSLENLEAIVETELIVINRNNLNRLFEKHPFFQTLWTKFIEFHYLGMEERVFELIALDAEERYARLMQHSPEFILKIPNRYIASILGMEPRHLSRIKSKK